MNHMMGKRPSNSCFMFCSHSFMISYLYHILGIFAYLDLVSLFAPFSSLHPVYFTLQGGIWAPRCWRRVSAAVYFTDESPDGSNRGLDGLDYATELASGHVHIESAFLA